jgi:hypothetical protein
MHEHPNAEIAVKKWSDGRRCDRRLQTQQALKFIELSIARGIGLFDSRTNWSVRANAATHRVMDRGVWKVIFAFGYLPPVFAGLITALI